MNPKPFKLLLITHYFSIGCVGVVFLILHKEEMDAGSLERDFLLKQARYPLVIHGFKFSSYDLGGTNITIKAVRLRIEKMKIGFLVQLPFVLQNLRMLK